MGSQPQVIERTRPILTCRFERPGPALEANDEPATEAEPVERVGAKAERVAQLVGLRVEPCRDVVTRRTNSLLFWAPIRRSTRTSP